MTAYRVYEGPKFHEFDHETIDKMKELGLIRFYGTQQFKGEACYVYRPTPRSRKVSGKKW